MTTQLELSTKHQTQPELGKQRKKTGRHTQQYQRIDGGYETKIKHREN